MKRTILALLACGLLAACEDLPTNSIAGMNGDALSTTNAAATNQSGTTTRGAQPTPAPGQYVSRTPPPYVPRPTPTTQPIVAPTQAPPPGAVINGNQVTVSFPEEESVSYVNGVPVKK